MLRPWPRCGRKSTTCSRASRQWRSKWSPPWRFGDAVRRRRKRPLWPELQIAPGPSLPLFRQAWLRLYRRKGPGKPGPCQPEIRNLTQCLILRLNLMPLERRRRQRTQWMTCPIRPTAPIQNGCCRCRPSGLGSENPAQHHRHNRGSAAQADAPLFPSGFCDRLRVEPRQQRRSP